MRVYGPSEGNDAGEKPWGIRGRNSWSRFEPCCQVNQGSPITMVHLPHLGYFLLSEQEKTTLWVPLQLLHRVVNSGGESR